MHATAERTIADLLAKRTELHAELTHAPLARVNSEWFTDRVKEMDYLNRQLVRLGAIPAGV